MTSLLQHARRGFVWPYSGETGPWGGQQYFATSTGGSPDREAPLAGYAQLANGVFKQNAIVFACELKRLSIFSEARFIYRRFSKGRPGALFSTPELDILERPWPRGTTDDLLRNMILTADIGGNAFVVRSDEEPDRLRVLRPDWMTIVMGDSSGRPLESAAQFDAEIIGFIYDPSDGSATAEAFTAEEVAHWAPIPDPTARFRGMSWMTPIVREAAADQAATMHKLAFFENGATPQLVVTFDATVTDEAFQAFVAKMDSSHKGWQNAYKTMYLGGGADATVIGRDMQQLDFSNTQGKGESRIAAASGIHPVLIPLSEGMQGSSLNAGNYAAARRSTADTTFRPLWRHVSGCLGLIVPPPSGSELWYDEGNIPFLREDTRDAAEIERIKAETINGLVREGFTSESSIAAVTSQDMTLLVHTGRLSVQLQEPGAELSPPRELAALPTGNGGSPT